MICKYVFGKSGNSEIVSKGYFRVSFIITIVLDMVGSTELSNSVITLNKTSVYFIYRQQLG